MTILIKENFWRSNNVSANLTALRRERRAILAELRKLAGASQAKLRHRLPELSNKDCQALQQIATQTLHTMQTYRAQKLAATKALREFEYDHNLSGPAAMPDRAATFAVIGTCTFVEGALNSALLVADGHFDLIAGFATGFALSIINNIVGTTLGFFGGRYFNYKVNARKITATDLRKRLMARIATCAGIGGMALLHFGAGRVRVTGSHSDIFDFSEIGLFASFNDYFAIALMLLGIIGSVIAFYKGRHGICDPQPHYSELTAATTTGMTDAAHAAYEQALAGIEALHGKASEALAAQSAAYEDAQAQQADLREQVLERLHAFNDSIDLQLDILRRHSREDHVRRQFIEQQKLPVWSADEEALNALRLSLPAEAASPDTSDEEALQQLQQQQAALDAAASQAIRDIEAAYSAYLAHDYPFNLNNQQGGDHAAA